MEDDDDDNDDDEGDDDDDDDDDDDLMEKLKMPTEAFALASNVQLLMSLLQNSQK